ncbi:MAG: entericidin A/B family lipoprotein [Roseovarius sp.]|nr:entericidin A/B family lipoprotein [Roseovarius sp.]
MRIMTLCLIAVLGLAGCETIQGAGRDIQNAGQTLEKAVN